MYHWSVQQVAVQLLANTMTKFEGEKLAQLSQQGTREIWEEIASVEQDADHAVAVARKFSETCEIVRGTDAGGMSSVDSCGTAEDFHFYFFCGGYHLGVGAWYASR